MRLIDRVIALRIAFLFGLLAIIFAAFLASMLALRSGSLLLMLLILPVVLAVIYGSNALIRRREGALKRRLLESHFGLCPGCGYPAAGRREDCCPECGDRTPASGLRSAWQDALERYWPEVFRRE